LSDSPEPPVSSLNDLYSRPGFMLRRAHQISTAIFLEETQNLNVTATQYGALYVLDQVDNLDQIGLARVLGIDRSTSGLVVSKLEAAGWVTRRIDPTDRRRRVLLLTDPGRRVLNAVAAPARQVRERLMAAFTPVEQALFKELLAKFVATFNAQSRTPITPPRD
jgi:DNA-binding MarR family transcriptional regulator